MVSTYAPQFRSNISFCFEIRSNHDCLSELMPQTVFKPAFISRASGASNSHRALPGKHYKYLIPLFHLLLRRHPFYSIFLLSLSSRTHLFCRLRDFKWSTPSGVKNPTCFGAKDSFFFSDGFSFQNPPGKILISPRYSPFSPSLFLHSLPYCSFLSLLES